MNRNKWALSVSIACLALSGCQSVKETAAVEAAAPPTELTVPLKNAAGQQTGTAKLTAVEGGVRLQVQASGLKPGQHGIHFHENGVCEGPDFTTAGSHFNPLHKEHGLENPKGAHAGDLPNLAVDAQGNAAMDVVTKAVVLLPDKPNSLYKQGGTSIIIHEQADDQKSNPAGNSGKRVACGVVK